MVGPRKEIGGRWVRANFPFWVRVGVDVEDDWVDTRDLWRVFGPAAAPRSGERYYVLNRTEFHIED